MSKLIVYEADFIGEVLNKYPDFNKYSLASICNSCQDREKISELNLDKSLIETTNLSVDIINGVYNRTYYELYLESILNEFENVHILIKAEFESKFRDAFPFMIDETEYFLSDAPIKSDVIIPIQELELITYNEIDDVLEQYGKEKVVNYSELLKGNVGFTADLNIDLLLSCDVSYVDISTLVTYVKIRLDQRLPFEMTLRRIVAVKKINFIVNSKYRDDTLELFPFICKQKDSNKKSSVNELEIVQDDFKNNHVNRIMGELDNAIVGHSKFKEALKESLIKFSLLNRLGRRKIMSIFICGDSGIGKTEFAKKLSDIMYPNTRQIKLNFGNYSNEGVLNSLIGSPLGYIGSDQGGELINKVHGSESKVILIDEFEKADGKVFDFFYELLEDGQFTDRAGNVHDLNHYIIIFTSNLSEKDFKKVVARPLISRFDMKYIFDQLSEMEKKDFISSYSQSLIKDVECQIGKNVNISCVNEELEILVEYENLREISRKIEDIVIKHTV